MEAIKDEEKENIINHMLFSPEFKEERPELVVTTDGLNFFVAMKDSFDSYLVKRKKITVQETKVKKRLFRRNLVTRVDKEIDNALFLDFDDKEKIEYLNYEFYLFIDTSVVKNLFDEGKLKWTTKSLASLIERNLSSEHLINKEDRAYYNSRGYKHRFFYPEISPKYYYPEVRLELKEGVRIPYLIKTSTSIPCFDSCIRAKEFSELLMKVWERQLKQAQELKEQQRLERVEPYKVEC